MRQSKINKISKLILVVFFAMSLMSASVEAQSNPDKSSLKESKIDALVQSYQKNGQFSGSVLVADDGKVIFKKGFGLASIEWNAPNEPDTKFRIGSVTKSFTALLIMQLVEEGKIKLEGKLSEYLPDYRKDIGDKVTVHHLLGNTSGIRDFSALPQFESEISRTSLPSDVFIKRYISGDLESEPGANSNYSNSNYYLLGAVIEKTTGKPYARVLREKILDPSGMKNTGYDDASAVLPKRASGYVKFSAETKAASFLDMSVPFAAGAMYSTVEDLYLFDQALYTEKLLSDKSKQMMFKAPERGQYGYGWFIEKLPVGDSDEKVVSVQLHGCGIPGFISVIVRMPETKRLIVLLENAMPSRKQNEIVRAIMSVLYDKPYQPAKK